MHVDREDDNLDVRHVLVLEQLQLQLILLLQTRRKLVRVLFDPLLNPLNEFVRAIGERLEREEGNPGASERKGTSCFSATTRGKWMSQKHGISTY